MSEYKDRFLELVKTIERPGFDKLMEFVNKSDFFTAPASTRFHGSVPEGLLIHSLNVYDLFIQKCESPVFKELLGDLPDDSKKIMALFHDICKTYFYTTEFRNKKIYSETGSKRDEQGRFDWKSVPAYTVKDMIPYGHGEKSVMMLEQYINLTPVERYAIRWHMGYTEPKENWNTLSAAMEKYPAILALHEADLEATHILEKDLVAE